MKNIAITLPLIVLVACGSIQKETFVLPNGKVIYTVNCSGFNQSIAACEAQADKLCAKGYIVHKNLSHSATYPNSDDGFFMPPREYLAVECKTT